MLEFALLPHLSRYFTIDRTIDPEAIDPLTQDSFDFLNQKQLGGRHNSTYYQRLKSSMACCCYGGNFVYEGTTPRVSRWDSWRWWETLAAGTAAIHLDFEQHNFLLPVMPKNWQHYIGIDLTNPGAAVERIQNQPQILAEIAAAGQSWAIEHYSSIAAARYFLDAVLDEPYGTTRSLLSFLETLPTDDA